MSETPATYTRESCPKDSRWFEHGGRCGWAHACDHCTANPNPNPEPKPAE